MSFLFSFINIQPFLWLIGSLCVCGLFYLIKKAVTGK